MKEILGVGYSYPEVLGGEGGEAVGCLYGTEACGGGL